MPPFATPKVPEMLVSVVDATQVGVPLESERTYPLVPAVVVESALPPLPYGMAPEAMDAQPLPPFATGRMPVTSDVRLMRAVATAPAVAFRKPDSDAMVREGVVRAPVAETEVVPVCPIEAVPAEKAVVEAFANWDTAEVEVALKDSPVMVP